MSCTQSIVRIPDEKTFETFSLNAVTIKFFQPNLQPETLLTLRPSEDASMKMYVKVKEHQRVVRNVIKPSWKNWLEKSIGYLRQLDRQKLESRES